MLFEHQQKNANADISLVRAALDFSQGTPLQRRKWWLSHSAEEALSLQTLQLGMFSTEYSFVVVVVKKNKRLVQRNETWSRRRAAWTNCSTECFGFVLFSERMFEDWPRFCLEIEASRFPARNTPRLESWAEYRMNGASLLKVWENWNQMFKSYLSRILGSTELQRLLVFWFFFWNYKQYWDSRCLSPYALRIVWNSLDIFSGTQNLFPMYVCAGSWYPKDSSAPPKAGARGRFPFSCAVQNGAGWALFQWP